MNHKRGSAVFGLGFLALGLLVGTLLAMSAQSLAQAVIAALFALFGGSIIVLLEKMNEQNQVRASIGMLGISVGALVGVYSGLYVNDHELLTPPHLRAVAGRDAAKVQEVRKYLRENVLDETRAIDTQYRNGMISTKEAYERLKTLLESK
jgi:hypothetical protein